MELTYWTAERFRPVNNAAPLPSIQKGTPDNQHNGAAKGLTY
jgi:hypothetical protein